MSTIADVVRVAQEAKRASAELALLSTQAKRKALLLMAKGLLKDTSSIKRANARDIKDAEAKGFSGALIDRLRLTDSRIKDMAQSLKAITSLKDPVGSIGEWRKRPNGLLIGKMRVSIGVVGIIYESRPNVTSDSVGLCLMSGNALILRGGSEAINSNLAIYSSLIKSAKASGIPKGAIGFIKSTDRRAVGVLLKQRDLVDLIIPRGGESLIKMVAETSRIPVIKHYKGVCHTYVDKEADLDMAEEISFNAKVQRPGVCNAMETLLVHKKVAKEFLPSVAKRLRDAQVEMRGCARTRKILKGIKAATNKDWPEEYLDLILSVKVVDSIDDAIAHIACFGSQHSDAIITEDRRAADKFLRSVDSAAVYINASTRFTDGGQFGMGAELGISTDRLHARGPMGLVELTTYKYVVYGDGQIRK
ncbi:MAG: glutamate-5-semialdehyde dehydrogenase [Candidatus Omnitrophica bacterium]|nr:glutamate-5-semialdehyde dehydrogenase [Candidatus Omnitrophota bacterium]